MYDLNKEKQLLDKLQLVLSTTDTEFAINPEFFIKEGEKLLKEYETLLKERSKLNDNSI